MKRVQYFQTLLAFTLTLLFITPIGLAQQIQISGKSPLTAANVIFEPYSIDKVYPSGIKQTLYFPQGAGQKYVDKCFVDVSNGFHVDNVDVVGSNDTTIIYRIDATSDAILNLYTKVYSTDIAEEFTKSVTWCRFIHYNAWWFGPSWVPQFDILNGALAGKSSDYLDPAGFSANQMEAYGEAAAFSFQDMKMKAVTLPNGNSYTPDINTKTVVGIADYQDLTMKVGYSNPEPVQFVAEGDANIKLNFATTAWQVTGVSATDDYDSTTLGDYKTEFVNVGTDGGHVTVLTYSEQLAKENAFMTSTEKQSYAAAKAASGIGWNMAGMQYGVTVQQGHADGPTALNPLVTGTSRAPVNNTILNVNLGYHICPDIRKDMQLFSVTSGYMALCDVAQWPWAPGILNLHTGITSQVPQNLWVTAHNKVIRQDWQIKLSFYVTVVPESISTAAILGMPKMVQDNMVIDASITGATDVTAYINDANPLGDFVRTAEDIFGLLGNMLWTILIIAAVAVSIYIVVKIVSKKR